MRFGKPFELSRLDKTRRVSSSIGRAVQPEVLDPQLSLNVVERRVAGVLLAKLVLTTQANSLSRRNCYRIRSRTTSLVGNVLSELQHQRQSLRTNMPIPGTHSRLGSELAKVAVAPTDGCGQLLQYKRRIKKRRQSRNKVVVALSKYIKNNSHAG